MDQAQLTAAEANALIGAAHPPTPLEQVRLDDGIEVMVKREDVGPPGSFKWRGALTACEGFRRRGAAGVVTASTGNQGAAVAWAASRVGLAAHVAVPVDAVAAKCELIARHGAQLHRHGDDMLAASDHALRLAREHGFPFFEDGASEDQLLGTATIGHELASQANAGLVIVPVAGGALAAGLGRALKTGPRPPTVLGVQSLHYSRIAALLKGVPYRPTGEGTFADGLADDRVVEPAFSCCRAYLDDVVTVTDPELEDAIRRLHEATGVIAEGAGAAALAALLQRPALARDQAVAVILTGGNLDPERRARILRR